MSRLLPLLLLAIGCGHVDESGDADTDADADGDTDTDADTDADTDTDTDTDADTDTDTDECAVDCGDPSLASCVEGECVCEGDLIDCDPDAETVDCFDVEWLRWDPLNCNLCGNACAAAEYCADGSCQCRPGLSRCGDECVDTWADSRHCGECNAPCAGGGGGETCDRGTCEGTCEAALGEESCLGGCIVSDDHPLCCGTWPDFVVCAADEVCVADVCVPYTLARGCSDCADCDACRVGFDVCCAYPGAGSPIICVEAARCPAAF